MHCSLSLASFRADGPDLRKIRAFYKTDGPDLRKIRAFYKTDGPELRKIHAFYKTDGPDMRKIRAFYKTDGAGHPLAVADRWSYYSHRLRAESVGKADENVHSIRRTEPNTRARWPPVEVLQATGSGLKV